jgi:HPt (histidine-containing phosphotransfer) domain-containing protein
MLDHFEAADPTESESRQTVNSDGPPIDLVHLSRQCQGDPGLEEELLALFRVQARALAAQLSDPQLRFDLMAKLAHKLCGSALAIGAGRVTRAARTLERLGLTASCRATSDERHEAAPAAVAALQAAVDEAVAEIERLHG